MKDTNYKGLNDAGRMFGRSKITCIRMKDKGLNNEGLNNVCPEVRKKGWRTKNYGSKVVAKRAGGRNMFSQKKLE